VQQAHDCTLLARKSAKPPTSWGIDSVSLLMAERRCINCDGRLAQALIDADPDCDTHPACDDPAVWLRHTPGRPMLRWNRG